MKFPDSQIAHKYLDGLQGIEIGASAHNPFNIPGCLNIDYTAEHTVWSDEQLKLCGEVAKIDIVASGDELPFPKRSLDYVLSSHVLEHFWDPIKALEEWYRVLRPGGIVFLIVPHKERTFDKDQARTGLRELALRHQRRIPPPKDVPEHGHYSFWVTADVVALLVYCGYLIEERHDKDDKVGNGFLIVARKPSR